MSVNSSVTVPVGSERLTLASLERCPFGPGLPSLTERVARLIRT